MDPSTMAAGQGAQQAQGQMDGNLGLLGTLILGAMKSREDQKRYNQQMKHQAIREKWSPWTGVRGKDGASPSAFGTMMQALAAGMQMKQAMSQNGQQQIPQNTGTTTMASNYNPYNDPFAMRGVS